MNIADLKAKLEAVIKTELVAAEHSRVVAELIAGLGALVDQVIEAELHRILTPGGIDPQGRPVAAVERDPNLVEHPASAEAEAEWPAEQAHAAEDEAGKHEAVDGGEPNA
jgi:hypothetical protein